MTTRKDKPASFGYPDWYERAMETMPWRDWGLYAPTYMETPGNYIHNYPFNWDNNFRPLDQQMPTPDMRRYQPPQFAQDERQKRAIANLLGFA